jgi:hypothetical protein
MSGGRANLILELFFVIMTDSVIPSRGQNAVVMRRPLEYSVRYSLWGSSGGMHA